MEISSTPKKSSPFHTFLEGVIKDTKPLQDLFNKFNNDWAMNSAAGLAYNLMTAMVPIVIAVIAVVGLTIGNLDSHAQADLITRIEQLFPSSLHGSDIVGLAVQSLRQRAGILGILAVLASIFGGSRLFVSIEGYFDIIYRTGPRNIIPQNVMAILMMLAFLVLIPLLLLASSIPALLQSLATIPVIDQIPGVVQMTNNAFFLGLIGIITGLLVGWILFEAIYIVVPNMRLSFRHSWRGAVVAAVGLEIFLALFPFYTNHFMGSYTGTAGFVLILLVFFYYFAVILLVGAEINAYFVLHVPPLPNNIAVVLRDAANCLNNEPRPQDTVVETERIDVVEEQAEGEEPPAVVASQADEDEAHVEGEEQTVAPASQADERAEQSVTTLSQADE